MHGPTCIFWANLTTFSLLKHYAGEYLAEWTAFAHPQLGAVEIGGVDNKWCLQNPPPDRLEAECARNTDFALRTQHMG